MDTPEQPKEDTPVQPIIIPGPVEVFSTKGWKEYLSEYTIGGVMKEFEDGSDSR